MTRFLWVFAALAIPLPSLPAAGVPSKSHSFMLSDSLRARSGAACGPATAVFFLLFETSPPTIDQLLGPGRTFQIRSGQGQPFTAPRVRQRLAGSLPARADSLHLSSASFHMLAGNGTTGMTTKGGDGLTLSMTRLDRMTRLACCALEAGVGHRLVAQAELRSSDLLLVRLVLEGRHYVATMNAPYLDLGKDPDGSMRLQNAFKEEMAGQLSAGHWVTLKGIEPSREEMCAAEAVESSGGGE